jgi:hypothetical protein
MLAKEIIASSSKIVSKIDSGGISLIMIHKSTFIGLNHEIKNLYRLLSAPYQILTTNTQKKLPHNLSSQNKVNNHKNQHNKFNNL